MSLTFASVFRLRLVWPQRGGESIPVLLRVGLWSLICSTCASGRLHAESWEDVAKGMRAGREALRSGTAEIKGVHTWKNLQDVQDGQCAVQMLAVFDYARSFCRFETRRYRQF
jgi:hypothetical protein